MENIIEVNGLGKRYTIAHEAREAYRYTALRDVLAEGAGNLIGRLRGKKPRGGHEKKEEIWALRNVNLEIKPGEKIGIIGRNGAGKSTLLKILSRITEPTEGYAVLGGRVSSLLEVGTGFHPELTGRENIYLNGAVLGLKKKEIEKKFDEIVDFSGVEKFLDTPVKRFSSGMNVRLAFAVAAHLEPEILLVDEVLAVGDAEFQKKCLGKMGEVSTKEGRTILFVSHNMNSIRSLCQRCLWIESGRIKMDDAVENVVSSYDTAMLRGSLSEERQEADNLPARFTGWEILAPDGEKTHRVTGFGPVSFRVSVRVNTFVGAGRHGIALFNSQNNLIWAWAERNLELEPGAVDFNYTLPYLPISPGSYYLLVSLYDGASLLDRWTCTPALVVATKPLTHPDDKWTGVLNVPCNFGVEMRRVG